MLVHELVIAKFKIIYPVLYFKFNFLLAADAPDVFICVFIFMNRFSIFSTERLKLNSLLVR